MRIALFGGTFDPPHHGHIAVAEAATERLALDRVLIAPVGLQPLKREQTPSSYADRLRMVELAIADSPKLVASSIDQPQPDGRPNYTIDTLAELGLGLEPGDELFCLMGADSFLTVGKWHRAAELLVACDFIVAARPGSLRQGFGPGTHEHSVLAAAMPEGILFGPPRLVQSEAGAGYLAWDLHSVASGRSSTVYLLPDLSVDVSATEIRAALAEGSVDGLIFPEVLAYIEEHGLYR